MGTLHTHSPTSIQMRPARKRSVTVILAQRENPLIEISAILTQCDRALRLKTFLGSGLRFSEGVEEPSDPMRWGAQTIVELRLRSRSRAASYSSWQLLGIGFVFSFFFSFSSFSFFFLLRKKKNKKEKRMREEEIKREDYVYGPPTANPKSQIIRILSDHPADESQTLTARQPNSSKPCFLRRQTYRTTQIVSKMLR